MKDKIRKEVSKLCSKNIGTDHVMSMTDEMHTLYCWALNNAPLAIITYIYINSINI